MPEYLAPGVYVEETTFRQKTIEGVSTSTTGFVGPTRFGPVEGEPELLTSYLDFERIYGGIDPLEFEDGGGTVPNDLAHAVRGFFENGGSRLYVSRTYKATADLPWTGHAGHALGTVSGGAPELSVRARYPGAAGRVSVTFTVRAGQDIRVVEQPGGPAVLKGAHAFDTVLVVSPTESTLYWLEEHFDQTLQARTFRLRKRGDTAGSAPLPSGVTGSVHVITVSVTVGALGRFSDEATWEGLAPDPRHRFASMLEQFAPNPTRRSTELYVPIVIGSGAAGSTDGVTVLESLLEEAVARASLPATAAEYLQSRLLPRPASIPVAPEPVTVQVVLEGGGDGQRPTVETYGGSPDRKSGLAALEDLEHISIVAAPGSTRGGSGDLRASVESVQQLLIGHCDRLKYRVAVLDPPDGLLVGEALAYRQRMDTTRAALYYPWIRIVDPLTNQEVLTPPSGFVSGIYARNDVERGVHKSPANEVVRLAVGFERMVNKGQQDVLNPEGVNCLRFFEGRGMRIWGARTISSDPEWRYLALRRFFAFLERSIDKGTQWAVFEPNGRFLWNQVRRTIEDFLFNEWASGRLMGDSAEQAYFVKCDRSTMTQSDFDNGRLVCLIGVAPLRPAEFVIFRIGQKTLDSQG